LCLGHSSIEASSAGESLVQKNEDPKYAIGVLLGNVPIVVDFPPEGVFPVAKLLNGDQAGRDEILENVLHGQFFASIPDPFWRIFFIMTASRDPLSSICDFDEDNTSKSIMDLLSGEEVVCKIRVLHGPLSKMLESGEKIFGGEAVEDVSTSFHGILSIDLIGKIIHVGKIIHDLLPKLENFSSATYNECKTKARALIEKINNKQYDEVGTESHGVFESLLIANRVEPNPGFVDLILNLICCSDMITGDYSRELLKLQNLVASFPDVAKYMGFRAY
jgi:hypothetical protein